MKREPSVNSSVKDKTRQAELLRLLFFPCLLLWSELLLRVFSGTGFSVSPVPAMLAAAGTGAFLSLILLLVKRVSVPAGAALGTALALLAAVFFSVESMLRTVYATYMTPGNLGAGAGSVMANYGAEFRRSLLPAVLRFALFLLPLFVYAAVQILGRWRPDAAEAASAADLPDTNPEPVTETTPASADKDAEASPAAGHGRPAARPAWQLPALLLAAGLLLNGASAALARTGDRAPLYGAQYSYHAAVESFGLLTATRLDLQYALLGNGAAGFSSSVIPSGTPSGEGSVLSGTDGSEVMPGTAPATGSDAMPGTYQAAGPDAMPGTSAATGSDALSGGSYAAGSGALSGGSPAGGDSSGGGSSTGRPASSAQPVYGFHEMDLDFSAEVLNRTKKTQQLSSYLSTLEPSRENAWTGLFRGKNLILVCAESYCDRFIRPELTPTLWRLTHNGIYFEEYYQSEWGGSTTTGELAFLAGLPGNNGDESLSGIADNNHYFTLGNQLQRLGYSSIAFHTGSHTYYKRNTTHENLGYSRFVASGNGMKELIGWSYASDSVLIDRTTGLYMDHQPFSVYYMTISGHAPYEKNSPLVKKYYEAVNAAVGSEYQEKTKYYICYQMELESAMTLLVSRLEEAGIADDTVIVLTGNHYPYGLGGGATWKNDRDYIRDLLHGSDFFRWEQDRSGLVIWSGCLEHALKDMACTVREPVGNLDILPTVSNLFGLAFDSRLLPGRDVFSPDTRPLVFWNNLSFVTTEGRYDGRKGGWYPNEGYEWTAEDPEFLDGLHQLVNDRLLMSRIIMQTDYYGLLFGPDEIKEAGDPLWPPAVPAAP